MSQYSAEEIVDVSVINIRFPTSVTNDGTDSVHTNPDYSVAYVTLTTSNGNHGYGITFTLGAGTDLIISTIDILKPLFLNRSVGDIFTNYRSFYRSLTQHPRMRWLGPEKGVVQLATSAITNAVWDLGARLAGKPLWRFVVDTPASELVKMVDWSYLSDVISEDEVLAMLEQGADKREERVAHVREVGYPAYIISAGWLGYSDEKVTALIKQKLADGWTAFKMKVGVSKEDDCRRAGLIRSLIGPHNTLMMDANQIWDVNDAVHRMKELAVFEPLWIEEPTCPDDIIGHSRISQELKPYNIGVATGEMCHNRVMFKQFFQQNAMQFCQLDSCRLGGVTEVLSIMVLAHKFGVPVCPHGGGVGLCELVRHYSIIDYILLSGTMKGRVCEYAEHLHEHFTDPAKIVSARYVLPEKPGFSCEMKEDSIREFRYPDGEYWSQQD